MKPGQARHLRLHSCIQTVLEVHQRLTTVELMPDLEKRFEELKEILISLDATEVRESDVRLVERATNHLLGELQPLMAFQGLDRLVEDPVH